MTLRLWSVLAVVVGLARADRPRAEGAPLRASGRSTSARASSSPRPTGPATPWRRCRSSRWRTAGRTLRLVQSMAILEWLDERFPDPPLLPPDLDGRARVRALAEHVNSGIQPLQNAIVLRMLKERQPGWDREWARFHIGRGLAALEARGAGRPRRPLLPRRRARARRLLPRAAALQRAPLRRGPRAVPAPAPHRGGLRRPRAVPGRAPGPAARRASAKAGGRHDAPRRSGSAASRRCTTTCATSSGAGASTWTGSTSPRWARASRTWSDEAGSGPRSSRRAASAIVCTAPVGEGGRAGRWLRKHPDGVGTVVFEVEDAAACFRLLEERGGTPIADVRARRTTAGRCAPSPSPRRSATPPSGSSSGAEPGTSSRASPRHAAPRGGGNAFGFGFVDHLTSQLPDHEAALLWMEHVLGFEEFWEVSFHTEGRRRRTPRRPRGAARLRAALGRDARRRLRREVREQRALAPRLRGLADQHLHRGPARRRDPARRAHGGRHRRRGRAPCAAAASSSWRRPALLRHAPRAAPDDRHRRASTRTVAALRELGILVDGAGRGAYLLQIFLKEAAGLYREPEAGPFFYEIIQRKGDQGFGAGNFRALFETIERDQHAEGRS